MANPIVQIEQSSSGHLTVSGELTFYTVTEAVQKMVLLWPNQAEIQIDFNHIQQADTASLLFLLHLERLAKQRHQKICFTQLPDTIKQLLELNQLTFLLKKSS